MTDLYVLGGVWIAVFVGVGAAAIYYAGKVDL